MIPFNKPFIAGRELDHIRDAVEGMHLAGDGKFTRLCHAWFEEHLGLPRTLLTTSCTSALEMAAILCEVGPGDEVVMPSYTFVTTANAFVRQGATPVFVDICPDTLNLDASLLAEAMSAKTRVIVPVHYAGVACDMERIGSVAREHGVRVVEDAAQAVGARYQGATLGGIGDLGCFSFHETKNFIAGEGGALVVNDPKLYERAEIIREKGTDRSRFFRGQVDKYTWVDEGSSFLPSELIAAFLYAQLEEADAIASRRMMLWNRYVRLLQELEEAGHLRLPRVPSGADHNAHCFYVVVRDEAERARLIAYAKNRGVTLVFHYVPLHSSPMGRKVGRVAGPLPVTEDLSSRVLRLPLFHLLSEEEQDKVAEVIAAFYGVATGSERT